MIALKIYSHNRSVTAAISANHFMRGHPVPLSTSQRQFLAFYLYIFFIAGPKILSSYVIFKPMTSLTLFRFGFFKNKKLSMDKPIL